MEVEMVGRLEKSRARTAESRGPCARDKSTLQIANCLFAMVLVYLASGMAFSQQMHVLLDDAKVQVTRIDLAPSEAFALTKNTGEALWIALDPLELTTSKGNQDSRRLVRGGDAESVDAGTLVRFHAGNGLFAHLIVVKPKTAHQELTARPFVLGGSLEDASDRDATLLIAVSNCRFRDTRDLGDDLSESRANQISLS